MPGGGIGAPPRRRKVAWPTMSEDDTGSGVAAAPGGTANFFPGRGVFGLPATGLSGRVEAIVCGSTLLEPRLLPGAAGGGLALTFCIAAFFNLIALCSTLFRRVLKLTSKSNLENCLFL